MNPRDPTERQRQPGQDTQRPAQQGGSMPGNLNPDPGSRANRQQVQQHPDGIGSDDDTDVVPLVRDKEKNEDAKTDDR